MWGYSEWQSFKFTPLYSKCIVSKQEVSPKKAKLEIAEAEYNATMALLEEKRNQLRTLEEQLADLHHKLNEANQRKQALEDDVTLCANKLKRAEKLIGMIV